MTISSNNRYLYLIILFSNIMNYTYKDSIRIMFTPYIMIFLFWFPLVSYLANCFTHPLLITLIADVISTFIVYLFSFYYKYTLMKYF
jgi:hypothetical protein